MAAKSDSWKTTTTNKTSLPQRLLDSLPQKAAVIAATGATESPMPMLAEQIEKAALFDFNLTLPTITVEFLLLKLYFMPLEKFMDEWDMAIPNLPSSSHPRPIQAHRSHLPSLRQRKNPSSVLPLLRCRCHCRSSMLLLHRSPVAAVPLSTGAAEALAPAAAPAPVAALCRSPLPPTAALRRSPCPA